MRSKGSTSMLKDQIELLRAFNDHGVRYLTVGGHAVGIHSEPRGTKDLDVFIASDRDNSEAVFRALAAFGAPLSGMSSEDFREHPESVFQLGVPPARVDIMQAIAGVSFEQAWPKRVHGWANPDTPMTVISRDDLIANKEAVGRLQDLADVEKIQKARKAVENEPARQPG